MLLGNGQSIGLKTGIIFISLFGICCCNTPGPELKLSTYEYDFGIIAPDSIYKGSVTITNIGKKPLTIRDVQADCGCTNAFVTKNRILPDDTCSLTFSFNAYHKKGDQNNHIFIEADTDSMVYLLNIHSIVDGSWKTR